MFLVLPGSGGSDVLTVSPVDATGWHHYAVVSLFVGGDNGAGRVPQFC